MSLAHATIQVFADVVGNVSAQELVPSPGQHATGAFSELGGFIKLGTATTVDVEITDANGKVVYSDTGITTDVNIPPDVIATLGPLYVTTTNISNSAHTLTVYWNLKK